MAAEFKTLYGKDLSTELKKELSGDFEGLILALMERPDEYDARNLHKAMAVIKFLLYFDTNIIYM